MPDPTHKLQKPFTVRGRRVESLTLRRPLVRDLIAAEQQQGGETTFVSALLAACAGVPLADFGHLDARDFREVRVLAAAAGFFSSLAAGASMTASETGLVYTLARPIEIDKKRRASLSLRWPLVRDLIAADREPTRTAADAALIAACGDIPLADLRLCDAEDFRRIVAETDGAGFFGGEAPGAPSSPSTPAPAGD